MKYKVSVATWNVESWVQSSWYDWFIDYIWGSLVDLMHHYKDHELLPLIALPQQCIQIINIYVFVFLSVFEMWTPKIDLLMATTRDPCSGLAPFRKFHSF